jgi:GntR family transcriptional regulator
VIKAESPQGGKPAQRRLAVEPRYVQVANELRAGIADGQFGQTGQLPTENTLCERYGVSRFTVREALRRLQAEGLIRRRRGSGTTIDTGARAQRQPISDITDLSHYAAGSRFDFAVTGPVTLAALAAAELGLAPGSHWIHLAGKRRLDASGPAVALTDVYIHADLAPHVAGLRPGNQSLFSQLADAAGFRIGRVDQDLRASAAGSREANALGIPRRAPVLRIARLYRDTDGRVVEASISVHPGDRFTYSMQIDPG